MTRIVLTGLGVVAPSGIGWRDHWASLLREEVLVRPIDTFDAGRYSSTLAGQVSGFDPLEYIDGRLAVQTDKWTWMSLVAAQLALEDAKYTPADHDPYQTAVFLASGSGGNEFSQREIEALWSRGSRAVGAYQSIAWFYAASTGQISIREGLKGPSGVVVSEGAGGLDSIGWARRVIRRGTDAVLVGGTEAGVAAPYALLCQTTSGRLTTAGSAVDGYKPFDVRANGYAIGEGGAILLVENEQAALAREAPDIWGEVVGYAATHDAHHHSEPAPNADVYAAAIRNALADASIGPDEVDLVIADGAGSPDLDRLEAAALNAVFGARSTPVPVTAPAGWTGRLMAGGSALNVVTALVAMREGIAPAVGNLDEPDPAHSLDLVRSARPLDLRTVLVLARGQGGFNSALVLRRYEGDE